MVPGVLGIHRAVADIAKHGDATKLVDFIRDGREALWVNLGPGKVNMIFHIPEREIRAGFLEKVRLEAIPLLADPCERQSCRQMYR